MHNIDPRFLLVIPFAWVGVVFVLSFLSGWYRLAQHYPSVATSDSPSESAHFRSGRIGAINYYSCLAFRANEAGLHIAVALPFRFGHPPLFIPWSDFHHISEDEKMYSQRVRMSVGRPTITRFVLPGWVKFQIPLDQRPGWR